MFKAAPTTIIRILFWTLAVIAGATQIWVVRHYANPDGISYIEIANNYLHQNWSLAINAYWSPLYSWTIALAFLIIKPSPYWEVATAHLVVFVGYLAALVSFELLMTELLKLCKAERYLMFSDAVIYVTAYSAFLFTALSLIVVVFVSPDMIALALTLLVATLILHITRTAGSNLTFALLGLVCGLLFLARTAFAPSIGLCLVIVLILRWRQAKPLTRPAVVLVAGVLVTAGPFVLAISQKTHRFTIGESGRLNYGWEVDGARPYIHWQGEPFDIGRPVHPTNRVFRSPETFLFGKPIAASYAPWYDPSYWYAGIQPTLKLRRQIWVGVVNLSMACFYMVRSPIFIPACLLILLQGLRSSWKRMLPLWAVLALAIFGIAVYCVVCVEKRYIAVDLLLIWLALLVVVPLDRPWVRQAGSCIVVLASLLFLARFLAARQISPLIETLRDLRHAQERFWNADYLLANRLRDLGLRPGDKVAYVGRTMDVEWARLAQVQIIGEVPMVYGRVERPFDNSLIEDPKQIEAFWKSDPATRNRVLQAFRDAGAKMVVADGFYCARLASEWPRILPPDQPHVPPPSPVIFSQIDSRYLLLDPHLPLRLSKAIPGK